MPGLSLPKPYPDELAGSILARAVIHNALTPKRLILRLLDVDRTSGLLFLPSDIGGLVRNSRLDPGEFLRDHTVLPYSTAYMSPSEADRLRMKCLGGTSAERSCLSSLVKSVARQHSRWRFCRACAEEDVRLYGESYWHRAHCMPAVFTCLRHGEMLMQATGEPKTLSQALHLPLPQRQPDARAEACAPTWAIKRLAEVTGEAFDVSWKHRTAWQPTYRALALANGYALSDGLVAGRRLTFDLQQAFGREFLEGLGALCEASDMSWPALMTRERITVPFAPVKHVLLRAFLESPADAISVSAHVYASPGPKARDFESLDQKIARHVMEQTRKLLADGTTSTVKDVLGAAGQWQAFRHNRNHLPMTCLELSRFKESDASDRKTGGRAAHSKRLQAIADGRQKPFKPWVSRRRSSIEANR